MKVCGCGRLVVNQIIEADSGEAYWQARVESQGKAGRAESHWN